MTRYTIIDLNNHEETVCNGKDEFRKECVYLVRDYYNEGSCSSDVVGDLMFFYTTDFEYIQLMKWLNYDVKVEVINEDK